VSHELEAGGLAVAAEAFEIVVDAVAIAVPALLVRAARVRAEQHAARLQGVSKLPEHPREVCARDVEERGVREHSVEPLRGQAHREEVLLKDLAARARSSHLRERFTPVEAHGGVTSGEEELEIAPRATPEVEDRERWLALDRREKSLVVLRDVV